MKRTSGRRTLFAAFLAALLPLITPPAHADKWITPTAEELAMTSQPEVPGAGAVYLNRVEITDDDLHMFDISVRLKVLTEGGKKWGDVELYYGSHGDGGGMTVDGIEGRTIHPDGTIIPFTGKPYEKVIEKTRGEKRMAKIFSMPDVQVGSIIEYHYVIRYDDKFVYAPSWLIQSELFTRKAHFAWKPTNRDLEDNRGEINTIAWLPILPAGSEVKRSTAPSTGLSRGQKHFEVDVDNVPPTPDEEHMPPISSFTYRVLFYYTSYRSNDEFWKSEGKRWAKDVDKFIGPGHIVTAAVQQEITTSADTQNQKLHKIYTAVMHLENTDFTREHTSAEEKAAGLKEVHTTDDIWARKRGSSDQLAELFVAMARAAGMKAYVLFVTSRDRSLFVKGYLSLHQLNDYIAMVNVDGKDEYFDPGSRYCPYGHLAWGHTMVAGLRQTDGGSDFIVATPAESYKDSHIDRIGDLTMDSTGLVTGTVTLTFTGAPALKWRQRSLSGDSTSLENELRESVERLMPGGTEVKVASIDKLEDYEQPLIVNFTVKGGIGSLTGKRILLPADVFEVNSKATFPHEKRTVGVYFEYPYMAQDAVRIKFPAYLSVESFPEASKVQFKSYAAYNMFTQSAPNSITVRRNLILGEIVFPLDDYPDLRSFYSKLQTKDQESVVLTTGPATGKPAPTGN
jgi:hypothetical protein